MIRRGVIVVLLVVGFGAAVVYWGNFFPAGHDHSSHAEASRGTYQCSMHPQIVSDKPGLCPICQMTLQRVDDPALSADGDKIAAAEPHVAEHKATYQCSMHPQIVSDKPDLCPICQMRLTRVDDGTGNAGSSGERKVKLYRHPMRSDVISPVPAKDEMGMDYIPVYDDEAGGASNVPGHAPFTLSTERQQLIGVTKEVVEPRNLDIEIRAVGRVAYDPKLYQAIVEYRQAVGWRGQHSAHPQARSGAEELVRSASIKLQQLGLSDAQIRDLTKGESDPVHLLLPRESVWIYEVGRAHV